MAHGQRRPAPGVAVRLREDHTGERQRLIKGLGGVGGVLAGHGVDHEQGLRRADGAVQTADLTHHLLVHVQTAGGIDDQHVHIFAARRRQGVVGDINRVLVPGGGEEFRLHLAGQGLQLVDGRRAVDVGGHHHHFLLFPLLEETRQLGHRGGLTGALQARHHDHHRRLGGQIQGVVGVAHGVHQLVVDDLDERLARVKAFQHLLTEGLFLDLLHELLDHRQGHVGLQQRLAHLAQGVADIVFGELPLAGQAFQRLTQAVREILEHDHQPPDFERSAALTAHAETTGRRL